MKTLPVFRLPLPMIAGWMLMAASLALPVSSAGASSNNLNGSAAAWAEDLTTLSLEDLMNIEVTSAGKKAQKLSETAAAVTVITQEEIRRSGATCIPEALRMVPGLHVARIDANKWAVTARGFSWRFANKLLVMMDGRTLYSSLFSGVFWDAQDYLMEDIDRIEVIRGPGATLWGANAVNGVINIITKSAADTQGGLVAVGAGSEERFFSGARYGGRIGQDGSYRLYAKQFERDSSVDLDGDDGADDWRKLQGGFRADWRVAADAFTLQGDIYDGEAGQEVSDPPFSQQFDRTLVDDVPISGGNLLGRWERRLSDTANMTLQLYYDHTKRDDTVGDLVEDTFDVDFQHRFALGDRQDVIWGLGYRYVTESGEGTESIYFEEENNYESLVSGFVQDELTVIPDRLLLTVGSKFEYNETTGLEIQPSARLLYAPAERHSLWAAVSRAVRTPSRYEEEIRIVRQGEPVVIPPFPVPIPSTIAISGNSDIDAEDLLALELGYRFSPTDRLSVDTTVFYNDYSELIFFRLTGVELTPQGLETRTLIDNIADGESYGLELAATWQALDWWQLGLTYSFLKLDLDVDQNSFALSIWEDAAPKHQLSLRSGMDLSENWELDLWGRYVDNLPGLEIGSYTTLDARLGWRPLPGLELSLVGQNLLEPDHPEFTDLFYYTLPSQVERSVYAKVTWRF